MDNASKALIMAGGVLITLMLIGVALYLFSSARGLLNAMDESVELSAVDSFNRYYESFGSRVNGVDSKINGIDVINIYNKVLNDQQNGHDISCSDGVAAKAASLNALTVDSKTESKSQLESYSYSYSIHYGSDGYIDMVIIN